MKRIHDVKNLIEDQLYLQLYDKASNDWRILKTSDIRQCSLKAYILHDKRFDGIEHYSIISIDLLFCCDLYHINEEEFIFLSLGLQYDFA